MTTHQRFGIQLLRQSISLLLLQYKIYDGPINRFRLSMPKQNMKMQNEKNKKK